MNDLSIKFALGALVIGGSGLAGRTLARVDQLRSKLLAETMDGMQLLRIHMLDDLMPLSAALEKSTAFVLRETGRKIENGDARTAWHVVSCAESARGGRLDCLASEDMHVLDSFFAHLGISSREEQKQIFDRTIRELGELESNSRSASMQKNRLYTALGALAGAAAVVGLM